MKIIPSTKPDAAASGAGNRDIAADQERDIRQAIQAEQARTLYGNLGASLIIITLLVIVVLPIYWGSVANANLLGWSGAMMAYIVARGGLRYAYFRAEKQAEDNALWLAGFFWGVAALGVLLGSAVWLIFPSEDILLQGLLFLILIGTVAGGLTGLQSHFPSAAVFLILILGSVATKFLFLPHVPNVFALLTAIFCVILLVRSHKFTGIFEETVRGRIKNSELAKRLAETNKNLQNQVELLSKREKALFESSERFQEIASNIQEVFWILSADWREVLYINAAYEEIWGRSRQSLLDDPLAWLESVHSDDRESLEVEMREKISGDESDPEFSDYRIVRPDGNVRWITARAYPVRNDEGEIVRFIGFAQDITQRRNSEAQLQQAVKMEAVGQLTGGVAHEFNNLLTVILGNLEALESRLGEDHPLQSFTSTAMKGALRGAELTQSLLAFSRKQRLKTAETELNSLVLGMQNLLQRTLGETIIIETDLDEELWCTSADANQIEAALLNFVLNARDAMPDGGTITVGTSNRVMTADTAAHYDCVEPGDYVVLEVSDTGTGMTDDQIEHAFEPFYTTKEVGKGTGLGLSVAYGFAKQSGG